MVIAITTNEKYYVDTQLCVNVSKSYRKNNLLVTDIFNARIYLWYQFYKNIPSKDFGQIFNVPYKFIYILFIIYKIFYKDAFDIFLMTAIKISCFRFVTQKDIKS